MPKSIIDSLVVIAGIGCGLFVQDIIADLTQVTGTKLAIARIAVWGAVFAVVGSWVARRPLLALIDRFAATLETRRDEPLARRSAPGTLERVGGALFAVGAIALTALAIVDADRFTRLFEEDGPFEYGSALLYFTAAGACLVLAAREWGRGLLRLWLGGLAALFVFVGGEEISWGQRLLDFGTPEDLAAVNVQGEFTLHNVYSNSLFVYPGLAVTAALLFVLPLLHRYSAPVRRLLDALDFPVAPPRSAALYGLAAACYAIAGLALGTPTPLPINWSDHLPHYDDELLEFLISALFAIHAAGFWRIAPDAPDSGPAAEADPPASLSMKGTMR